MSSTVWAVEFVTARNPAWLHRTTAHMKPGSPFAGRMHLLCGWDSGQCKKFDCVPFHVRALHRTLLVRCSRTLPPRGARSLSLQCSHPLFVRFPWFPLLRFAFLLCFLAGGKKSPEQKTPSLARLAQRPCGLHRCTSSPLPYYKSSQVKSPYAQEGHQVRQGQQHPSTAACPSLSIKPRRKIIDHAFPSTFISCGQCPTP